MTQPPAAKNLPRPLLEQTMELKRLQHDGQHEQLLAKCRYLRERFAEAAPYLLEFEALALQALGRTDEAVAALRQALASFEQPPLSMFTNLCDVLREASRLDEAEALLHAALILYPNDPALLSQQVQVVHAAGRLHEALELARRLCQAHGEMLHWNHLANLALDVGLYAESMDAFRRSLESGLQSRLIWHNYLFLAHYLPDHSKDDLLALHRAWYATVCGPLPSTPPALLERERLPDKQLRIGIFSSGLQKHPAGWMSSRPLQLLSRLPGYAFFFYNTNDTIPVHDEVRDLFRSMATSWQDAGHWSDERLYEQALADRLDMAIDMSGHSDGTALPLFAIRLAPVQIKWVGGLFNTSGVPAMDYLLTDRFETPDGVDSDYVEKLVRLPHSYIAYVPPDYSDDVPEPPLLRERSGGIVFGCFNNAYKINPVIVEIWAGILKRVPGSSFFFKGHKFAWPDKQQVITDWFAAHGIGPERLRFEGGAKHRDLLYAYRQVDIALDPWPYTGGLTTLEALWMGVPVLTTPGPTFAGRHAASHLCNAGLAEFVQPSFAAYADMAVELAQQPELLDQLRELLRLKVASSPLVNHRQLAADLDTAFRAMWARYCEGLEPIAMRFEAPSPIPDVFCEHIAE